MRIPEVRDELRQLAVLHGIPRLDELADELIRRSPMRRTPPRNVAMTPRLARSIRAYFGTHPNASHQEIADRFGVNAGRVSEAINGKRR